MKFLIDNCLSPKYATILGFLGHGEVAALREEFAQSATDPVWIREIGARGWIFVSVDRSQLRTPDECEAIKAGGAVAFYLAKKYDHMKLDEQAWRIMKAWPEIARRASSAPRGACYLVSENGKVDKKPVK